ncbi:PLASTID MOVEMENT IMPAIRED 1-RELATED 1-like protein [Drosera capensis]
MSRVSSRKQNGNDAKKGKLLQEIEVLSKNIYLEKNPSKGSDVSAASRSNSFRTAPLVESNVSSRRGNDGAENKDKKSFWNWKSLKALSHVRNRRFNCCFTLQVHKIDGLPHGFDGLNLRVHWKRRDTEVMTSPVKVIEGVAEFEEGLTNTCSVYGSRSGPHHSAKYEAKHFLLYAAMYGSVELDLGKHRVDLTKLLPLTLEELEDEKSSGKWATTYNLSGSAKGAVMSVSFGYLVLGDSPAPAPNNRKVLELLSSKHSKLSNARSGVKAAQEDVKGTVCRSGSVPSQSHRSFVTSRSTKDIEVLHEVLQVTKFKLSHSQKVLDEEFDQEPETVGRKFEIGVLGQVADSFDHPDPWNPTSSPLSVAYDESLSKEAEDRPSFVTTLPQSSPDDLVATLPQSSPGNLVDDHGTVIQESSSETKGGIHEVDDDDEQVSEEARESEKVIDHLRMHDSKFDAKEACAKEILEELDSALKDVNNLENSAIDTLKAGCKLDNEENNLEAESSWIDMPDGLEDLADFVEAEFLNMLGNSPAHLSSEKEPESPREHLLREFEKENSACCLFDFDNDEQGEKEYNYNAPRVPEWLGADNKTPSASWEDENPFLFDSQGNTFRPRARVLEDMETEALMQEWGLYEDDFQIPPPTSGSGFGSAIDLPPEEPAELPPLGEGLGPYVQTKNGGFLRSMNPTLFSNAKAGGNLIMQVSCPVVVPAEMGPGVTEILHHMTSIGIEKLSVQANKLMPLEDITGKTMEQISWETSPKLEDSQRQASSQLESEFSDLSSARPKKGKGNSSRKTSKKQNLSIPRDDMSSEYVCLDDLAPLAMDKIEALSIEGLRMQSGMSEEAPPHIDAQIVTEYPVLHARSMGLDGAVGLQLLDRMDDKAETDGLMDLSLTLDAWMKLDTGEVDEDQMSERTSKILAAHHATSTELTFLGKKGENRGKGKSEGMSASKRCGFLGNNFTVALMVQLRDPMRNYEPVGTPMLALIQVERVFLPPKPRVYSTVSKVHTIDDDNEEPEKVVKVETKEKKQDENILEEVVPQYKISDVHLAGLKTEPDKKKLWGGKLQQQSGSRWLLANGMGKSNKHPLLKAKVVTRSSKPQAGSSFWSVSGKG